MLSVLAAGFEGDGSVAERDPLRDIPVGMGALVRDDAHRDVRHVLVVLLREGLFQQRRLRQRAARVEGVQQAHQACFRVVATVRVKIVANVRDRG